MSNFYPERDSKIIFNQPTSEIKGSFHNSGSQIRIGETIIPQHSRISTMQMGNTQYIPKIVESGYIVGPPIAYTNQPNLPTNFSAFSPRNGGSSIIVDTSSHYQRDFSPHHSRATTPSKIANPPPIHFVSGQTRSYIQPQIKVTPPISHSVIREETISKVQYDRCVSECKNWETKYNELYLKYMNQTGQHYEEEMERLKSQNFKLRQKVRDLENKDRGDQSRLINIKELIEKHKESSLKEVYLLLDRYRLECKQSER